LWKELEGITGLPACDGRLCQQRTERTANFAGMQKPVAPSVEAARGFEAQDCRAREPMLF
jgi:hypothetical protein